VATNYNKQKKERGKMNQNYTQGKEKTK